MNVRLLMRYLTGVFFVLLLGGGLIFVSSVAGQTGQASDISGQVSLGKLDQLSGQRIMHVFDFEERTIHFEELPMYWTRIIGPPEHFPHYAQGRLDSTFSRSGQYSFLLKGDGGSVGFEYGHRKIRIRPGRDFYISGYVHMENVTTARVQMQSMLTDRQGKEIPSSQCDSILIAPTDQGPDGWARFEIYMSGNYSTARFLTLKLFVLQESQWNRDIIIASRVFKPDIKAEVWFDDISVFQLPRVMLATKAPGNVFDADEPVELHVEVQGVNSLDYQMRMVVHDAGGQVVYDEAWFLAGLDDQVRTRVFAMDDLPVGLYRVRMDILSGRVFIASRHLTFVKLAPLHNDPAMSGGGFGLLFLDDTVGNWDTAVAMARLSNARQLKVPVWRRRADEGWALFTTKNFDQKLRELSKNNIQITATFSEVPDALSSNAGLGRRGLMDVLSQDGDVWIPQVEMVLARYARQVPCWQIGGDDLGPLPQWDPRIRYAADVMKTAFNSLASQSVLAVPMNAMFGVNSQQLGSTFSSLTISPMVPPASIGDYIDAARDRGLEHLWVTLGALDSQVYRREDVFIDMAHRLANTLRAVPEAVFLNHPWTSFSENTGQGFRPDERLLVFRTFSDLFGGMRYSGTFSLAPGVMAMIFDRDGLASLFVWNDGSAQNGEDANAVFQGYLGKDVYSVDLFGNALKLPTDRGKITVSVGRWPVILSKVDSRIAWLLASVTLDPSAIEASIVRQHMRLQFVNPFDVTLSGRLRFGREDGDPDHRWGIDPSTCSFVIKPGQAFSRDLVIRFPRNELGGAKTLAVHMSLEADESYSLDMDVPFTIHIPGIESHIFTRRMGQDDLLIQLLITNTSDVETSLYGFVDLPDGDHLERPVSRLSPGMTVTKWFRVPNVGRWLGSYVRVGFYDPRGTRRINYHVEIK